MQKAVILFENILNQIYLIILLIILIFRSLIQQLLLKTLKTYELIITAFGHSNTHKKDNHHFYIFTIQMPISQTFQRYSWRRQRSNKCCPALSLKVMMMIRDGDQSRNLVHAEVSGQAASVQQLGRAKMFSAIYSSEQEFMMKSLQKAPPSACLRGTCLASVVAQQSVFDSGSFHLSKICPLSSSLPTYLALVATSQSRLMIPQPWAASQQQQQRRRRGKKMYRLPSRTSCVQGVVALVMELHKGVNLPLVRSSLSRPLSESYHSFPTSWYCVEEQLSTKSCWKRTGHTGVFWAKTASNRARLNNKPFIGYQQWKQVLQSIHQRFIGKLTITCL